MYNLEVKKLAIYILHTELYEEKNSFQIHYIYVKNNYKSIFKYSRLDQIGEHQFQGKNISLSCSYVLATSPYNIELACWNEIGSFEQAAINTPAAPIPSLTSILILGIATSWELKEYSIFQPHPFLPYIPGAASVDAMGTAFYK